MAVNNPDKFKKFFISEDGKKMSLRKLLANKVPKGAAISIIALFMIFGGSACREVPAYTDPEPPAQPKSTETLRPTPTKKPTETQEPTKTSTSSPTAIPTEEDYRIGLYSAMEELEKFGFRITGYEIWNSEKMANEVGLTVVSKFIFEGHKVTDKGLVLVGTGSFENNKYPVEILINPQESFYLASSGHFLDDKEAIEKWLKVGREYYYFAFVMNNDDTLITSSSYGDYTDEEWKEMKLNIDKIFRNGGSTPEFYLSLAKVELIRW